MCTRAPEKLDAVEAALTSESLNKGLKIAARKDSSDLRSARKEFAAVQAEIRRLRQKGGRRKEADDYASIGKLTAQ